MGFGHSESQQYRYTMIRSVNFVLSPPSENLENIECKIIELYNDLLRQRQFPLQNLYRNIKF
jgi:hypothetical protein